jgi:hypothetical protein
MLTIKTERNGVKRREVQKEKWLDAYLFSAEVIVNVRTDALSIQIEDTYTHLPIATYSSIDKKWRFHTPNG